MQAQYESAGQRAHSFSTRIGQLVEEPHAAHPQQPQNGPCVPFHRPVRTPRAFLPEPLSIRLTLRGILQQASQQVAQRRTFPNPLRQGGTHETSRHPLHNCTRHCNVLVGPLGLRQHEWQNRNMRTEPWQHQSHRENDAIGELRQNKRRHRRSPGPGLRPPRTVPHRPGGGRERPCYLRGQGHRRLRGRCARLYGVQQHRCRHDVWRCGLLCLRQW